MVYFKSSCILKTIPDKIRYLCDHKIKWEPYNKGRQNAITQCSRCQQFGHAESNCNNSFRCVKCLNDHEPRKCTKTKDDKPMCVNCKLDHPANYRNCKAYKDYISMKKKQQHHRKPQQTQDKSVNKSYFHSIEPPSNEISYSNVLKNQNFPNLTRSQPVHNVSVAQTNHKLRSTHTQPNNNASSIASQNFIFNEVEQLFGISFIDLSNKIKTFLPMYLSENNRQEKKLLLLNFLIDSQIFT